MKRDKIILAFILIPFFLFSLNLKNFKFKSIQKTYSSYYISKPTGDRLPSERKNHPFSEKPSYNSTSSLRIKAKESVKFNDQDRGLGKIPPESDRLSRFERNRERNSDMLLQKIIQVNQGNPSRSPRRPYAPDQVLVKFKPHFSNEMREATIAAYQCRKIRRIPKLNIYQLLVPESVSLEEMLFLLRENPDVEYAEPNHIRYLSLKPNDVLFQYQYALHNSGQEAGPPGSPQGTETADISAREGWDETTGIEDVVIAILDTGIDFEHPDLENKIHSTGYDFANDDSDPTDDHFHGTHVSGIAAADTNNREGIAGVGWDCEILPVKVVFVPTDPAEEPYALVSWIIDGIRYAVDNEADVINLSLGGDTPNLAEEDAVRYAYREDVVVVAAAGNEDGPVSYPAAYDEYVLGVAATDYDDLRWSSSNFGPEVDVAAPGVYILSCYPVYLTGEGYLPYAWVTGTSMAAPHAAGLAALIRSIKPKSILTADDIMNVIRYTSKDINRSNYEGRDDFVGYGRISMEIALVPIEITSSK